MAQANVHDRLTIERLYPRDAFDRDLRKNADVKTEILHGIRVMSAPDANGDFILARASRHVAEQNPEGDVIFVFPHRYQGDDALMQGPDYGGPEEKSDASRGGQDSGTAYDMSALRLPALTASTASSSCSLTRSGRSSLRTRYIKTG